MVSGSSDKLDDERLLRLVEVGSDLVATLDLDEVLERLLETARDLTAARYAAVGVLEPRGQTLERFLTVGFDDRTRRAIGEPPQGLGVLGELIRDPRPLRLDDVAGHPASVGFPPGHPPIKTFLGVPIVIREELFGNLYLAEKRGGAFGEVDTRVAVALADWAAIAIDNARSVAAERLHESIQAAERERGHWARELHDETLQGLGALQLVLRSARRSPEPGVLERSCDQALELLQEETSKLRALISELRPAALDEVGLEAALEGLAERSSARSGLEVRLSVQLVVDATSPLDPETETTIYRIVQEALTNVERHGSAQRVDVVIEEESGEIATMVSDDGVGFDLAETPAGFGRRGMRERAELTGGELIVDSSPGAGCRVRAVLSSRRAGDQEQSSPVRYGRA